jgi:hypothetical protein
LGGGKPIEGVIGEVLGAGIVAVVGDGSNVAVIG